jgi:endonuclease/exonuclease/phosphatase family metal-dependent hydrolase
MLIKQTNRTIILLGALLLGACSPKVNPAKNAVISGGSTLKVMSYNIHHANPPSKAKEGLIDVDAIASVINREKPDLVGLQELDNHTKRSGNIDEAALIGQKTGLHYQFFKSIDYDGGDYGLAILSRYPIESYNKVNFPQKIKGEARILSYITVKIPGKGKITFANTHLDAQHPDSNRVVQVKRIMEEMNKQTGPIIITGDFNSEPNKETIRILDQNFKRSCVDGCPFTIPESNPNKTIDYIAIKNAAWAVTEHKVIPETYASDHRPVTAVFQIK